MKRAERRRQLLEVAASIFAERGYHGTTTAELARAAGVTEPILYQHFPGKQALFITLIEMVGDEVLRAWTESLAAIDSPRERLRALLASNPATHERGRGVYRVILHAMTESGADPAVAHALRSHVCRLTAFVEAELKRARRARELKDDLDAAPLATLLIHAAIGAGLSTWLGAPSDRFRRRTLDQLFAMLTARA
jgi:AcrR family transcriptional regulator